jgi:hypothetical protein
VTTMRTIHTHLVGMLHRRTQTSHRGPDRGSHAVEYALGIGLGAATILALFAAYKSGVAAVIQGWILN